MQKKSKVIEQNTHAASTTMSTTITHQNNSSTPPGYTKKSGCGCGKRR
ncbi:hypothetical protein ACLNAL_33690 [Bacillus sp. AF62]